MEHTFRVSHFEQTLEIFFCFPIARGRAGLSDAFLKSSEPKAGLPSVVLRWHGTLHPQSGESEISELPGDGR